MEPSSIHSPAGLVPLRRVLELAEEIENSERPLFELDKILVTICRKVKSALPPDSAIDFVAVQLFNKQDRTIQTVYQTGSQEGLVGLAKHAIDGDDKTLDIQAFVFNADPPRITIISGWDSHFDRLLYEQFDHASLVRAWIPVFVLRDAHGKLISKWQRLQPWSEPTVHYEYTELIHNHNVPRYKIDITLNIQKLRDHYGRIFIEKIGTIEVGHNRLMERISPATAVCLADTVTRLAYDENPSETPKEGYHPSLRETTLDFVLETTATSAMRMLQGNAASLHFCYDEARGRYVYEVAAGAIGPDFLDRHPPRKTGLGSQALKEKRPFLFPDIAAGQDPNALEHANPAAWALGIRTMAAFPLIIGDKYGVLYIGLALGRFLTDYEYDAIKRFIGRAIQAIRASTYHIDALDEKRRLTILNSVACSLVSRHDDPALLDKIGGNTLNLLAADVVTIHEYSADKKTFSDSAVSGHCISSDITDAVSKHISATRIVHGNLSGMREEHLQDNKANDLPEDVISFYLSEGFVLRLTIILEYADEVYGVMFVYYRRDVTLSASDRKAVEILAAHAALAIRIRRSYQHMQNSFTQLSSEIGHDFNRQVSRLASSISSLKNQIDKAPYVSEVFWNSEAGDLLNGVVECKNDLVRFAVEFQEYGKGVTLARRQVEIGALVNRQASGARKELRSRSQAYLAERAFCQSVHIAERLETIAERLERIKVDSTLSQEPLIVEVDETYIARAIDAVISNAVQALCEIKKVLDSPRITLSTRADIDSSGRAVAVISISDNGEGIIETRKTKIFQLFYTTRVNEGGNGIGLASARRYIELNEGTIEECGQFGVGATFIISFPLIAHEPFARKINISSLQK